MGVLALGVSFGSGCFGSRARRNDISDSTFVAVMADLRRAVQPNGPEPARDSAGRQAIRDSIMRKYHVTPAALESTAAHLADRQGRASDILRAIDRKMQSK